jgi:hypothetical protein
MRTLSIILASACLALTGCGRRSDPVEDKTQSKTSTPEVRSALDREFAPEPGVEYNITGSDIFRTSDSGPASRDTSIAWSVANEFVYRTALGKEYSLPASSVGPDGNRHIAKFTHKQEDKRISVGVNIHTRTATLNR